CEAWSAGWNCACCAQPIGGRVCGLGRYWPFWCLSVYLCGLFGKDSYSISLATACKGARAKAEQCKHREISYDTSQQNPAQPKDTHARLGTQRDPVHVLAAHKQHGGHGKQGRQYAQAEFIPARARLIALAALQQNNQAERVHDCTQPDGQGQSRMGKIG